MELKVMNLEDLNLVELNVKEVEEIDGGGILILPITGFICGYLYEKYIA